jgi:hypothetical protein
MTLAPTTAVVDRCIPRRGGGYWLVLKVEHVPDIVQIHHPEAVAEGKRIPVKGGGRLWEVVI